MKDLGFSDSIRKATDFVAVELLYPSLGSQHTLTQPAWSRLGWFSRIAAGPVSESTERAVINYCAPMGTVVERNVSFYMGKYLVAEVSLRGVRNNRSTYWAIAAVEYRLNNPADPVEVMVRREFLALSFSGVPGESAPED